MIGVISGKKVLIHSFMKPSGRVISVYYGPCDRSFLVESLMCVVLLGARFGRRVWVERCYTLIPLLDGRISNRLL